MNLLRSNANFRMLFICYVRVTSKPFVLCELEFKEASVNLFRHCYWNVSRESNAQRSELNKWKITMSLLSSAIKENRSANKNHKKSKQKHQLLIKTTQEFHFPIELCARRILSHKIRDFYMEKLLIIHKGIGLARGKNP